MPIKLKDIAAMAKVSVATASLAMNGSPLVSEETRRRILALASVHEYTPNAMAKGLARRRSGVIGLVVPDIESAYYGKLVSCIDKNVRDAGYSMILSISNDEQAVERKIIQNFIAERVEGVLLAPVNKKTTDMTHMHLLETHKVPCVFVTSRYPQSDEPFVMVDLEEGTFRLVSYLLETGHRNIYFLCGSRDVITTSCRISGYEKAYKEKILDVNPRRFIECNRLDYDHAYETTERLLQSQSSIDAIITINDVMALAVTNAIMSSGKRVPADISVAGYDNMIFSRISPIPITTVMQDIELMSRNAVDLLFRIINSGIAETGAVMLRPELIVRESTAMKA